MGYKERLERATLMAMQGVLANPNFKRLDYNQISVRSVMQAENILERIDIVLANGLEADVNNKEFEGITGKIVQSSNQETQEQEPKRGDVVFVRDENSEKWIPLFFVEKVANFFRASDTVGEHMSNAPLFNQMTTKNPYAVEEEDREPKVGDMCYFWDNANPKSTMCGFLESISNVHDYPLFYSSIGCFFKYCSLKNPLKR